MSSKMFQLRNRGQLSGPLLSAEVTGTLERSECFSPSQDGSMMEGESLLLLPWVSFMLLEYHTTNKNHFGLKRCLRSKNTSGNLLVSGTWNRGVEV